MRWLAFVIQGRSTVPQAVLLFLIGFSVYAASLKNEFVLDDWRQFVNNELVESISAIPSLWAGASMSQSGELQSFGAFYRPVMMSTYAISKSLFGANAFPLHLAQLLLHTANAIVFLLLLRLFVAPGWALLGAALFLVHPMNVESVAYIATIQEPFFAFFGLSALLVLATSAEVTHGRLATIVLLLMLSLFSKETGVLFLVVAVLLGLWRREIARPALVAGVAALGTYLAIRVGFADMTTAEIATTHIARASWDVRLLNVPMALWLYLSNFLYPHFLATNQDWLITHAGLREFWLPAVGVLAVMIPVGWWAYRLRGGFLFFYLWALVGLLFHAHILVPLDGTVSERWFYFPCFGFAGLLCLWLNELRVRGAATVVAIWLVILAGHASARSLDWHDDFTLASQDVITDPTSAFMQNNVGAELIKRGRLREAKVHLEESVRLHPTWNVNWNNLGVVHLEMGDLKKAEECFLESFKHGVYLLSFRNYAWTLIQQNRREEARTFIESEALPVFPTDPMLKEMRRVVAP